MYIALLALHGYVQVQGFTSTAAAGTAGQAQSVAHPPKLRHAFLQVCFILSCCIMVCLPVNALSMHSSDAACQVQPALVRRDDRITKGHASFS
jgi:hypothetical protein